MTISNEELAERLRRFDLYDERYQDEDPLPFYDEVRERCPVARAETYGEFWILSRHEDIEAVLRNGEDFSTAELLRPHRPTNPWGPMIPTEVDEPDHVKYRRPLNALFSPGQIANVRPLIRGRAQSLVQQLVGMDSCEFVTDFAAILTSSVFLQMLGVPEDKVSTFWDYKESRRKPPESTEVTAVDTNADTSDILGVLAESLAARRADGGHGDDIISKLTHATIDDRPWTDEEVLRTLITLAIASVDTTTTVLTNIVAWLAQHPDRRAELIADPSLMSSALEEFLRVHGGIVNTGRTAVCPVEVGDAKIEPGDYVMLMLGAANRDPRVFDDPQEVDFRRSHNRHLSFGISAHRCLGMHLARETIAIALEELHAVLPDYHITPGASPTRRLTHVFGIQSLPLTFGPER